MNAVVGLNVPTERLGVTVLTIPTEQPEADGTFAWDKTTVVLVEVEAGGQRGLGYTYAAAAAGRLIEEALLDVVVGCDATAIPAVWAAMNRQVRNIGRPGLASMAISAVDAALWDLKGQLLGQPVVRLLGAARAAAPVYGSGGFTTYPIEMLQRQLADWVSEGIPRVKMKIGTHPEDDAGRVAAAREVVGPSAELFVDANGAYSRKQALAQAEVFTESGVAWFEEPVSSDDLEGLRLIRDRAPAGMEIAAGEYGFDLPYFRRMLEAEAVDVLQTDATRCGGITGFLHVASLCAARGLELSAHCAPSLHAHPCCAVGPFRHLEYFHDHVRIEHMLFDGAPRLIDGALRPDLSRPGLGLEFKAEDAARFVAWRS